MLRGPAVEAGGWRYFPRDCFRPFIAWVVLGIGEFSAKGVICRFSAAFCFPMMAVFLAFDMDCSRGRPPGLDGEGCGRHRAEKRLTGWRSEKTEDPRRKHL